MRPFLLLNLISRINFNVINHLLTLLINPIIYSITSSWKFYKLFLFHLLWAAFSRVLWRQVGDALGGAHGHRVGRLRQVHFFFETMSLFIMWTFILIIICFHITFLIKAVSDTLRMQIAQLISNYFGDHLLVFTYINRYAFSMFWLFWLILLTILPITPLFFILKLLLLPRILLLLIIIFNVFSVIILLLFLNEI